MNLLDSFDESLFLYLYHLTLFSQLMHHRLSVSRFCFSFLMLQLPLQGTKFFTTNASLQFRLISTMGKIFCQILEPPEGTNGTKLNTVIEETTLREGHAFFGRRRWS